MIIRPTKAEDIPALQAVLEGTMLFPSEMLPQMIGGFLADPDGGEIWMTAEVAGKAAGFCYAAAETLADATWNMRAIAVLPAEQGKGHGAALCAHLEAELRAQGQRIVVVDTSGTDDFAATRDFYRKNGYVEEARIRDFWAVGDDKVVFWKSLA